MSPSARSVAHVLMLEPSGGREAWREWRAGIDLDTLDGDCLAVLPLLAGRLREWLPEEARGDPAREIVLGICKRGWAQNQLRYREAAATVNTLRQAGADPIAIFGPLAWALLYQEERAVRPIDTLDLLIPRDRLAGAASALQAAGWSPEPGTPSLDGQAFDRYSGIWFRSASGTAVQLAWRLWNVSPELAREHETVPARQPVDLSSTRTFVVQSEELLLEALTRERDTLVSWQCDAIVLLRNRTVDWPRLRSLARSFPAAAGRLERIGGAGAPFIPPGILEFRQPGLFTRRLSRIQADYRRVSWAAGTGATLSGFAAYLWKRVFRRTRSQTS